MVLTPNKRYRLADDIKQDPPIHRLQEIHPIGKDT